MKEAGVDTVWFAIESYDRDDYPPKAYRTLEAAKAANPPPRGSEWKFWPARPGVTMPDRDTWAWEDGPRGLTLERTEILG